MSGGHQDLQHFRIAPGWSLSDQKSSVSGTSSQCISECADRRRDECHAGEVSLAHNGVLFLDELAEFPKRTLDALRQPVEDKKVCISRVNGTHTFPSNFMFVAAMNPCPCGYYPSRKCTCTDYETIKYRNRISGPIMDRIDIQKQVHPVDFSGDILKVRAGVLRTSGRLWKGREKYSRSDTKTRKMCTAMHR